jgi:protein-L-isoaspartate(D-aspartate) O-methyltransferase
MNDPAATDLEFLRAAYAREIIAKAGVDSPALARAFASVEREQFLGAGPWQIIPSDNLGGGYVTTPDANPRHLYQRALIAIDATRRLNNGDPVSLAGWIDQLALEPGDRVAHVGCGVGYYTAIMAELVAASGEVVAVEYEPELAERARAALASWPNVETLAGDGSQVPLGSCDAIFVNAGATSPSPWLHALSKGGRLLVSLTVDVPGQGVGAGHFLRVVAGPGRHAARFVSPVMIYPYAGARTSAEHEHLSSAYRGGGQDGVQSLRSDPHPEDDTCWLHEEGWCLSLEEPGD